MEQWVKAERSARVALHAKMKGLGFRPVADGEWASGVRRIVLLVGGEFAPWTTFWNPGVSFGTPEAAVVWAETEGWGVQKSAAVWVEVQGQLGSLEGTRIVEAVSVPDSRRQG